jgi:diadenosine tetraphosphate (Ap4A) HIT family hydrolase
LGISFSQEKTVGAVGEGAGASVFPMHIHFLPDFIA